MNLLLYTYLGSALAAMLLTPPVIRLARRIGAVDQPGWRSVHKRPIPRIGGVAIYLSTVCLIGAVLFLDDATVGAFRTMRWRLTTLFGSATFIFLIGLIDDLKGLPAKVKFMAELLAAGSLCFVGVRIDAITIADGPPLPLGGWGCVLTLLWVVGITNAVNLSDGLDGLAAGVSAVTCAVIAILAMSCGDNVLAVLMLVLVGSLCGFLVFNFNPAKIFMGDCGSLFVGYVVAASSVMCTAKTAALVGLTLPALALGVPILDTLFSMLRRFLEGRSLFAPDRGHFHHHLLDLGLRQRQAVIMIYLVTLSAGSLGLFMLARNDLGSVVIFVCLMLLIILLFDLAGVVQLKDVPRRLRQKHEHSRQARKEQRIFEHMQLRFRQAHTAPQKWQAVCEAAHQLEVAWVSLQATDRDGRIETSIWRQPGMLEKSGRIVTVNLLVRNVASGRLLEFEMGVLVNGSLESANHRVNLLSRLIDESAVDGSGNGAREDIRHDPVLPPHTEKDGHHGAYRRYAHDRASQGELESFLCPLSRQSGGDQFRRVDQGVICPLRDRKDGGTRHPDA